MFTFDCSIILFYYSFWWRRLYESQAKYNHRNAIFHYSFSIERKKRYLIKLLNYSSLFNFYSKKIDMWILHFGVQWNVIENSACRTKIYRGRREIDIANANRPNSYDPVHFAAIIRILCHFGGACSLAMHHRPRDGYLSIETGRNRGKYTSIYITSGCWLVTLSRTANDSMICRSATVPCQIWPAAVLAGTLTRRTPVPSFIRRDRSTNARVVTLDYPPRLWCARRFVLGLVMSR